MNRPVVFQQSARTEFLAAADWYEQRRTGLGESFVASVQKVLDRMASQPDFYPKAFKDIHEALVFGYPYCVYYREARDHILVIAVFHSARDPPFGKAERKFA